MGMVHLTKYTRSGRSIFRIGKGYYVLNSRHTTRSNAEKSYAYKDSFYFGKTSSKIVKYGRYYLVLQNVTRWFGDKKRASFISS
jgi:hypothetical protein